MAYQFSYRGPKAVLLAAIIAATSTHAEAQTPSAPPAAARVSISQVQLALVGSAAVGGGTFHFKGRNYPFTINGLGVGGLGVSKLEATGDVYQLARISDLDGVYGQVRVGWALANQGNGRLWLQNDKGVVLRLRTKRQGLMLAIGADADRVRLR